MDALEPPSEAVLGYLMRSPMPPELPPASIQALHPRHAAVLASYLSNGYQAARAAESVGYAHPSADGSRILRRADVRRALADLRTLDSDRMIATVAEIRENLTRIALDPEGRASDRTAASAHLLKSLGALGGPEIAVDARSQTVVYRIGEGSSAALLDALDILRRVGAGESVEPSEAQEVLDTYLASGENKSLTSGRG